MSITKEQAEEMQRRVNDAKARRLVGAAVDMFTDVPDSPHVERKARTRATVGAKAERASGAAMAQPSDKYLMIVGIDPGTSTGYAICYLDRLYAVETVSIYTALKNVEGNFDKMGDRLLVRFEDARLRTWFGKSGPEKWKGAGSIMRDCAIWEETLTALGIPFEKVPPKEVKETSAEYFKKLTGWAGRTSVHSREAGWLVLPFLKPKNT